MAYVRLDVLETLSGTTAPGSNDKLQDLTPEEDAMPAYFSVEDIVRISNQTDFHSIKKMKGKFWGRKHHVWVGYKEDGTTILQDVIALACPPYYKPHAFPGVDISDVSAPPPGFPTLETLPPELS